MKSWIIAAPIMAALAAAVVEGELGQKIRTAEQVEQLVHLGDAMEDALQALTDAGVEHSYISRKRAAKAFTPSLSELEKVNGPIDGLIMAIVRNVEQAGGVSTDIQILFLIRSGHVSERRYLEVRTGP